MSLSQSHTVPALEVLLPSTGFSLWGPLHHNATMTAGLALQAPGHSLPSAARGFPEHPAPITLRAAHPSTGDITSHAFPAQIHPDPVSVALPCETVYRGPGLLAVKKAKTRVKPGVTQVKGQGQEGWRGKC